MDTNRKYSPMKISRGWYYVEYYPPIVEWKFAILHLTIPIENPNNADIVLAMEEEARVLLRKFPVPLMVSAFDIKEDLIDLTAIKSQNSLLGFIKENGDIFLSWEHVKDENIPDTALNKEYVDNLYSNFEYIEDSKYDSQKRERRRNIEKGFALLLFIPFVITVIVESFLYFNNYFSLFAFIYILFIAVQKSLYFAGMWPKSKKEKEQEKEERLKEHYYYYCKLNPDGFAKLKLETLEKMAKERTLKEAEALKRISHSS